MNISCEKINCPYLSICDIRLSDDNKDMCAYAKSFIDKANKEEEDDESGGF